MDSTIPLIRPLHLTPPKIPQPGQRNVLITSALPYVNNVPHLGNLIGCVLSADVWARYCRQRGLNTLFICGTDEYGTATETKAIADGVTPREICDKYHAIHAKIYDWFQIKFDHFGRTSTQAQTEITHDIFTKLNSNGHVSKDKMNMLFCSKCRAYLSDRLVSGLCPHCNGRAFGDQCNDCGLTLNPDELVHPECGLCDYHVQERKSEEHLYLNLSTLQERVAKWLPSVCLDKAGRELTDSWIKQPLRPKCITRQLSWGTPVPLDGFRDKVFYVWFDAPIGYLSITRAYTPQWEAWWKNPDQTELCMFMGVDNVVFHTVMWPSTLLGTGDSWTMMKRLSTCHYLSCNQRRFSKSLGTGIFGDTAMQSDISVDAWRYSLLSNRPESGPADFSMNILRRNVNNELLANLGNFVNRVISLTISQGGTIPLFVPHNLTPEDIVTLDTLRQLWGQYIEVMDSIQLRKGLGIVMSIGREANQYFQKNKPWVLAKTDLERLSTVMTISLNMVLMIGILSGPFVPNLASTILWSLGLITIEQTTQTESHPYIHDEFEFPSIWLKSGQLVHLPAEPFVQKVQ